ncbi:MULTISPECIES: ABC transporter substrate-binding protein [Brevibacillus]|jgi:iron complex transport system substrate-binding protein|uniref:ABC transporter substrate-binding protein n=1 Tax=Brevibacillus TaxID=55080 RepID=UPI00156ABACC|nr:MULTISPECIES: iron-siderophore ABC transporter substrate-binding protein [Brevibacillus]MDH6351547.1 iron complex transport system substrate-binding protein [Brevibacillus sp. 1238]MDR4997417.1 iron-siderophore ABC transporter substrate-binding protein [Brevibacillus parabrevis]UED69110.1 iron-siderophore ABC transporter substrate-binding protein [Brevibacillus sp. HD3.3A]
MQQKPKLLLLLLMTMVLSIFTAACGSADNKVSNNSEAKPAEQTRKITHPLGTTEIVGTPKKVVTLFQGATDVAVALNVKPVGAVESWSQQPVYEYLRDSLKDVENLGVETQPNLELVSKLKPDLIIASISRHEKIYDQLSKIAPTVMIDPLYDFKNTLTVVGQALNKEAESKVLLDQWDKRVADLKTKLQTKLGSAWPLEATVLNFREDHARIYVTGFAGDILDELGFIRSKTLQAEADKGTVHMKLTSVESIPSMNAKVLFVFKFDDSGAEKVQKLYQEWTNHPLWKGLDAVKSNNVHLVDEVTWNVGGGIIAANLMLDDIYQRFGLEK